MALILAIPFRNQLAFLLWIVFLIPAYFCYNGNYLNQNNFHRERLGSPFPGQRKGFWCNYMVKRNTSCIVSKMERRVEKYFYLCSSIYSQKKYCPGYRSKYITRYATEYRVQPVMIKDCCPGFSGISCDKECFNCTTIKNMQETIEKIQTDQRLLARIQLQPRNEGLSVGQRGDPGTPGKPGPPGTQGPPGPIGPSGPMGPRGPAGGPGLSGIKGEIGPEGRQGIEGKRGEKGEPGPPGLPLMPLLPTEATAASHLAQRMGISAGDIIMGAQGAKGEQGMKGDRGEKGETGPVGPSVEGRAGKQGPVGRKGEKGERGSDGLSIKGDRGDDGKQGDKGHQGEIGKPGQKGDCEKTAGVPGRAGIPGIPGIRGTKGVKGEIGSQGSKGDRGPAGVPGLPAIGLKQLRDELARLKAKIQDLEKNRCNCPNQGGLGNTGSLYDLNKK